MKKEAKAPFASAFYFLPFFAAPEICAKVGPKAIRGHFWAGTCGVLGRMTTSLVIHGHFYQPPRENPWTGHVEREPSAHPYHDWNERIHRECYRPNGYARVVDAYGRLERIVNNYANLSFNFGPTLLSWLESRHPETYARILEADRESLRRRGGHGNAIAQGYHHAILPLCNERDRRTQIRWGVSDFRQRFGREPESLWLPETACNDATLDALIEEGLKYVILSPHQAERVRPLSDARSRTSGDEGWRSVGQGTVDSSAPYAYFHRDGSGRQLAVFFYDGQVAKGVAFDGLLASSHVLLERIERAAGGGPLVNVATDGESYGHHYRWGDRCIAYALEVEAERRGLRVTNYGEFLASHPPEWEVEVKAGPGGEGTAWSCSHGLGRWARDCGCHAGSKEGWTQMWRAPLRAALDLLRDDAAEKFETAGGDFFRDPWAARDDYVELLISPEASREQFLRRHSSRTLREDERVRALMLLEMQRYAMGMYTSCGWFFNDVSGIETVQVLRYAGRVLDLLDELRLDAPRARFLEVLAEARSNLAGEGSGADVFRRTVKSSRVEPRRVAAHLAISELIEDEEDAESGVAARYAFRQSSSRAEKHGRISLLTTRLTLETRTTGRRHDYAVAAMHFGDIDYYCALRPFSGEEDFSASAGRLWSQFRTTSLPVMLRLAQEEFGPDEYGLEDLLPEGRQRLSRSVYGSVVERFMEEYERLYEEHRRVIGTLSEAGLKPPLELRAIAELLACRRLENELRAGSRTGEYGAALEVALDAASMGYRIERPDLDRIFEKAALRAVRLVAANPTPENFQSALTLVKIGKTLGIGADLERAQEDVYAYLRDGRAVSAETLELAEQLGLSPVLFSHAPEAIAALAEARVSEASLS